MRLSRATLVWFGSHSTLTKFWERNYSETIELAAEICRPSLDPDNDIARQLLEEYLEPSVLLPPHQMRRVEWVRAVIAMKYEDDAAYLYRLHGDTPLGVCAEDSS